MSYFNNISIKSADSPSIDSFARWRVSSPFTLFDSKQIWDTGSLVWDTKVTGNATASYSASNASVVCQANISSSVIRQTKRRFNYQPGKSQLIITTANFNGPSTSCIKRVGYFDQNNGMYFMSSGSSFGIGLRSKTSGIPVDTFYSQSNWNIDKFDGYGPSGKTLDLTKSQIYFEDFEWLGVGRIRYGIFQGGVPYYVHEITNINALSTVYMSTPNLPVRYEIVNSGSSAQSLLHICSAVTSEGGSETNGTIHGVSNASSAYTINAGAYNGLIALRLKSGSLDGAFFPLDISSATGATAVYELTILLNPTTSSAFSWQDVSNSALQYATASAAIGITNEGTKYYSTVVGGTYSSDAIDIDTSFPFGSTIDGVSDVLVLGWRGVFGNATNACASITWRERN